MVVVVINLDVLTTHTTAVCVLMRSCARVLVCSCARVLVCSCAHALVCPCAHALACSCTHALIRSCARVLMRSCGLVCSCARVLVCSCARVLVCSCAQVFSSHSLARETLSTHATDRKLSGACLTSADCTHTHTHMSRDSCQHAQPLLLCLNLLPSCSKSLAPFTLTQRSSLAHSCHPCPLTLTV